jgi:hypothetical protein
MMEHIPTFLMWIGIVAALALVILAIRHTDRFGKERGPIPRRLKWFLMWVIMIAGLALTFWETQHGNTFLPVVSCAATELRSTTRCNRSQLTPAW